MLHLDILQADTRRLALPPSVLACPNVSPRAKFFSKCCCW
jgi:hypothetical protein